MTRSMLILAAAVLSLTSAACSSRTVYVRPDEPYTPAPPPPPPPREVVIVQPRDPVDVLRADDIRAGRVAARVIYADTVRANGGHIGQIIEVGGGRGGHGRGGASGDISASDVVFDEIYADNITADYIEADIVYVRKLKLGDDAPRVGHRPERERDTVVVVDRPRVEERGRDVVVVENPRQRGPRDTVVVVDNPRHREERGVRGDKHEQKRDEKIEKREQKREDKIEKREQKREKKNDDGDSDAKVKTRKRT